MGAKYLPTKKDLKLNQRFAKKELLPKSGFKKPGVVKPTADAKPAKKDEAK